jgi:hypothetical protein
LGHLVWLLRISFLPIFIILNVGYFLTCLYWEIEKLCYFNWVPIQYYSACILFRFCTQKMASHIP